MVCYKGVAEDRQPVAKRLLLGLSHDGDTDNLISIIGADSYQNIFPLNDSDVLIGKPALNQLYRFAARNWLLGVDRDGPAPKLVADEHRLPYQHPIHLQDFNQGNLGEFHRHLRFLRCRCGQTRYESNQQE
jgi:hypothetical protein